MFSKDGVMFCTVRCSVKKVFLEILQNLQENICVRVSFLMMIQAYEAYNFIKERDSVTGVCFPENFLKFLRTPFFHRTPLVDASVWDISRKILVHKSVFSKSDCFDCGK